MCFAPRGLPRRSHLGSSRSTNMRLKTLAMIVILLGHLRRLSWKQRWFSLENRLRPRLGHGRDPPEDDESSDEPREPWQTNPNPWCSRARWFFPLRKVTSCDTFSALSTLQLPLAAVTQAFHALRGSHSWRSSACGSAIHATAVKGSVYQYVCQ